MAKTYYKYAKRDTSPVDYAGAAKGLSEGLMATVTGLEKKADKAAGEVAAAKSKIEKEFAKEEDRKRKEDEAIQEQYGDKVSRAVDLPLSYQEDYKTVQSVILDLSADAADLKANIKREYDAGNMTTKDYNRKVNNIRDQFKMMKQTAVTSLDMVTATNTSVEEGDALPAQHYLLTKMLKGRFDSANAQYNIDEDGNIFADITDPKTGKVEQMSVYDMNKLSMQRLKPFDIDSQAGDLVEAIGAQLEMARGSGETIEDLLEKAPIMKRGNEAVTPMDYIEKNINGYSPNQLSSILQMKMSGNYDISTDSNNFGNDNFIVYEVSELSGQYEAKLTENQKQDAKDFATEAILTQLNPLKKQTTKPSASDIKAREGKRNAENTMNRMREFFEGSTSDREQVLTTYIKETQGIIPKGGTFNKVEVIGDKLFIRYTDKDRNPTDFPKGGIAIPDNLEEFVKTVGPVLTGNKDLYSLLKGSGVDFTSEKGRGTGDAAFEVGTEEYKGQNIIGYEEVIANVSDVLDTFYLNEGRRTTHAKQMANDFISKTGMKDVTVTEKNKVMTISTGDLGSITVDLKPSDSEQVKENLTVALKKLHDAVSQGKNLGGGTTEPPKPDNTQVNTLNATNRNKE